MQKFRLLAEQELTAQSEHLTSLRQLVSACLQQHQCTQDFIQRMVLAVNEGGMNIIQHGYGNNTEQKFTIEIYSDARELIFLLTDNAPTVNQESLKSRDLDDIRPGGLGVYMMYELMDQVDYLVPEHGMGNVLQMKKRLELET